jgi:hypothetical protein
VVIMGSWIEGVEKRGSLPSEWLNRRASRKRCMKCKTQTIKCLYATEGRCKGSKRRRARVRGSLVLFLLLFSDDQVWAWNRC